MPRKSAPKPSLEQHLSTASFDDAADLADALEARFGFDAALQAQGVAELVRAGVVPGGRAVVLRVLAAGCGVVPVEVLLECLRKAPPEETSFAELLPAHSLHCHQILESALEREPNRDRIADALTPAHRLGLALIEGCRGRSLDPAVASAVLDGLARVAATRGLVSGWSITVMRNGVLTALRLSDAQSVTDLASHFGAESEWLETFRKRALEGGARSLSDLELLIQKVSAEEAALILARGNRLVPDAFAVKRVMTFIARRRDEPAQLLAAGRAATQVIDTTVAELFITLGIEGLRANREGIPKGVDNQTAKRFRARFQLGEWMPERNAR